MQKNKDCCNLRGNLCAQKNSATKNTHMTKRKNILYIFSFLIGVFFLLSSATPVFALGERYKRIENPECTPREMSFAKKAHTKWTQEIQKRNTLLAEVETMYDTLLTQKPDKTTSTKIESIKEKIRKSRSYSISASANRPRRIQDLVDRVQPHLYCSNSDTREKRINLATSFMKLEKQLQKYVANTEEIIDNLNRLSGDTCGNFVLQGNEACESFTFVINGKNYSQTKFFYNNATHKSQENDCGALDSTKEFGRIRCVDCFIVKDQCSDKPITTQAAEEPLVIEEYQSLLGTIRVSQMSDPAKVIGKAIKLIMQIIGSITLVLFVFSGIMWMTAAGNAEREKKAMNMIFWTSAGVIVILTSYIIVNFIFKNVF